MVRVPWAGMPLKVTVVLPTTAVPTTCQATPVAAPDFGSRLEATTLPVQEPVV